MSEVFKQSNHIRLLPEGTTITAINRSRFRHPSNTCKWVLIGGKAFFVTPRSVYRHILADGTDYYPYYDHSLTVIDPDDLDNYPAGDNYDLYPELRGIPR
jgi:hypothetical protein